MERYTVENPWSAWWGSIDWNELGALERRNLKEHWTITDSKHTLKNLFSSPSQYDQDVEEVKFRSIKHHQK